MNFSNFRFTLDLHSLHSQTSIPVMLGDTGITWHINLCDGGKPYLISNGALAKISIKRPTGTYHETFCEIRENTTIVYPFEQETCAVVGLHNCEITLYGVSGAVLGTPRFSMVVSDRVIKNDEINLTDHDHTIVDAIAVEEAKRQVAEANRAEMFEQTLGELKENFRNSAIHIGPEAPENGETVWLDTSDETEVEGGTFSHKWDGTVLTVYSGSGVSSADLKGPKGEDGNDYVLTEDDITEIAKQAAELVPSGGGSGNVGGNVGGGGVVTEDVEYTFDGDIESSDNTWVSIWDVKSFVKVADVPKGKINLVGGTVKVVVPSNHWANFEYTITDEMLNETVTIDGYEIKSVDGFTQIFYQKAEMGDGNPMTMVAICTTPGEYAVAFNRWTAVVSFVEPGIYFMTDIQHGGMKHVGSLTCTVTSGSDSAGETEGTVANPAEYDGNEIQVFTRGLCIGDSITEGVFNDEDGQVGIKKYSYPSFLERITGIDIVNAGISGSTSKTWYEASLDSTPQWGRWVNDEWVWSVAPEVGLYDKVSTELNYTGYDFAIIHLGINDIFTMGSATIEETVSVFETNIYNIINKLKTSNTGIKVFLCTIIPSYAVPGNAHYAAINEKIREIANATEDVFLIDLNAYSACVEISPYSYIHLTAIGYHKMATEIKSLISYTIKNNLEKFKKVQFIGEEHSDNEGAETAIMQPDLAENNPNAAGYVKNRTHYSEWVDTVLFPEQTITISGNQYMGSGLIGFVAGETYTVVWNGVSYTCVAEELSFYGTPCVAVGNPVFVGGENNNMPFAAADIPGMGVGGFMAMADGNYTVSVVGKKEVVHQLEAKYSNEFRVPVLATDNDYTYSVFATVEEIATAIESGKQVYIMIERNGINDDNGNWITKRFVRLNLTHADYEYYDGEINTGCQSHFLFEGLTFKFDEGAGQHDIDTMQKAVMCLIRPSGKNMPFTGVLLLKKYNGNVD